MVIIFFNLILSEFEVKLLLVSVSQFFFTESRTVILILFPFRPEVYEKTPETAGLAEIIVAKHRNGETGKRKLHFAARCSKFEDLALDDPALTRPDDDWDE